MSHYTVLVKLKKEQLANKTVDQAINDVLLPYQEVFEKGNPYCKFSDYTDEVLEDAKEIIEADSYCGKEHPEFVGQPRLALYENDLGKFAEDYHGYVKENINGETRYGHYRNPNAQWDWYQIGGRWRGILPVKSEASEDAQLHEEVNCLVKAEGKPDEPLTADMCRFKDLDRTRILATAEKRATDFWNSHQEWLGLRDEAKRRGAIRKTVSIIGDLREHLAKFTQYENDTADFSAAIYDLDVETVRQLIEERIEPKCTGTAARFRYLFNVKEWDQLKELEISNEAELIAALSEFKDEGYDEGTFNSQWSRLDWDHHDTMGTLGFVEVTRTREPLKDSAGNDVMVEDTHPFGDETRMINMWTDIELEYNLDFTLEDLKTEYRWAFEWSTWAVLDENGWQEKGKMGWWGLSDTTQEGETNWKRGYYENYLQNEDPETMLVVVDCHI